MTLADASAGLGLRRALLGALQDAPAGAFDFLECAPENWIGVGGRLGDTFAALAAKHPITCHGLSLSLGGPGALDTEFVSRVGAFLDRFSVGAYSEHLSYCSDDGQLYDLLPIPFTDAAVRHVSDRIRRVQDQLGRRIAIENVSYYAAPHRALDEADFVNAVLDAADCDLLLDVNNVYVNAINHGYDPLAFLAAMPTARIAAVPHRRALRRSGRPEGRHARRAGEGRRVGVARPRLRTARRAPDVAGARLQLSAIAGVAGGTRPDSYVAARACAAGTRPCMTTPPRCKRSNAPSPRTSATRRTTPRPPTSKTVA